jgi:hypothetical protein
MAWLVFSTSFPASVPSTARVAAWRRLKRLGAISPRSGLWVLPEQEDLEEAVGWLSGEVRDAGGDALVMRVLRFEGLLDPQLQELFRTDREEDYRSVDVSLDAVRAMLPEARDTESTRTQARQALSRARAEFETIEHIDYFSAPSRARLADEIAALALTLAGAPAIDTAIESRLPADFRGRVWSTRPRPYVDRLACAWLIRRFVDSDASIVYTDTPPQDAVTFDLPDATFGHQAELCSFEVMVEAFGLDASGLQQIREIVHEIDLHDGRFERAETPGVEAILAGARVADLDDAALERFGLQLFDLLFARFGDRAAPREA